MAKRRVEQARKILDTIGIGGARAKMYNLSSSEGPRFAQYATEFTEEIKKLGPNPLRLAKNKAAWKISFARMPVSRFAGKIKPSDQLTNGLNGPTGQRANQNKRG